MNQDYKVPKIHLLTTELEPEDGWRRFKYADSGWRGLWNRFARWYLRLNVDFGKDVNFQIKKV